jgi:ribosomal-protein-alanine N-acetyltransferase
MALEIRTISPEWQRPLADFFAAIRMSGERNFHPHPFTDDAAIKIANYCGNDLYYLVVNDKTVLAYGMLRGWDEGFEVPSLGIAVHPSFRGRKLGELLMHFLHVAARQKGARQIRLKVYATNSAGRNMYTKLGYSFDSAEADGQLVGILEL